MRMMDESDILRLLRQKQEGIYRLGLFESTPIMDTIVNTKLSRQRVKGLALHTQMMNNPYVRKRAAQPFKRYEGRPVIDLRAYDAPECVHDFLAMCLSRKSATGFENRVIPGQHLSALLKHSYGVTRIERIFEEKIPWGFRCIPSPGGLFASEIYLILCRTDFPPGLYHYRPDIHALEQLKAGDFSEFAETSCGIAGYLSAGSSIPCVIICTSLIERLYIKYGLRSYKFMLIETGILAQQLTMVAHALGLGSRMFGGYFDDEVDDFLGVDGVLESVQNVMVVGWPTEDAGTDAPGEGG